MAATNRSHINQLDGKGPRDRAFSGGEGAEAVTSRLAGAEVWCRPLGRASAAYARSLSP